MKSLILRLSKVLGIDKSIFYTSSTRIIQGLSGIISLFFIAKYLTGIEQGFYYTFGSIVAIQIFFELGLNGIITQYVAHEVSNLEWVSDTQLEGESKYKSRLSSLLHFSIKWYTLFALALFLTLIISGYVFFTKYYPNNEIVNWKVPWVLLSVCTSINLLLAPILAFLEGLGKIKEVAKIRFYLQILGPIVIWISLIIGAKLFTSGLNWIINIIIVIIIICNTKFKPILINIWRTPIQERVDYKNEIFPYQWKIALSWISGYFIFQLFNPVLFAIEGAVVAGQMGMTLAALNGVQGLSLSWISTKVPLFSGFIAQKQFEKLDSIFNKTLKQSVFINGVSLIILFLFAVIINEFKIVLNGKYLGERFLNYIPMALMILTVFINQFISSWATYLRCHKKEPFLLNSIVGGILCMCSTIFLGKYFGVLGVTGGYSLITMFLLPWSYWIYKSKKKIWHISSS